MFEFNKVKVIGVTQPVVDFIPDSEGILSYAARVSSPNNQENFDTAGKLLAYCVKHKHYSVFETCSLTMEIETPRDIARQILRHRSFSFQEFCVAEGTKISTVVGGSTKKVAIEDLYKRYKSQQYWNMADNVVRVFDEKTKTLVQAKIKEVFKTGVKTVYKMTLDNGRSIESTQEHKFLTQDGFSELGNIRVGDFIGCNGVPVWQMQQWLAEAKFEAIENGTGLQGIADKAGTTTHTIRKWLRKHNLQFTKKQVAAYTEVWNKGLEPEKQPMFGKILSEETRQKMKESSKKGSESPFFTGMTDRSFGLEVRDYWYKRKNNLIKTLGNVCAVTGKVCSFEDLEIDHIKPLSKFPELAYEITNIQLLCKEEHRKKSAKESSKRLLTASWHKVVSIELVGEKETYDMEIEHESHNYVANGIITHNSQRYAQSTEFIERECRLQDTKNRQNSFNINHGDGEREAGLINDWYNLQQEVIDVAKRNYEHALSLGIAKEVSRVLLPEGLTMSKMYMNGTVRSWLHFIEVRDDEGVAQKEVVDVARKVKIELLKYFPCLGEVLNNN